MAFDDRYHEQVRLLVSVLPFLNDEPCFALKGGTAINLFMQPFPRLSIDIDLVYLPLESRNDALKNSRRALARLAAAVTTRVPDARAELQVNRPDELRVLVRNSRGQIKIEVSPVMRGTVHPPEIRDVVEAVENLYGFAAVQVVSLPDLYGGKLCAALDRQHPRDLFDVRGLLDERGLDRSVFEGFLVYLLCHPRPINEVINPRLKAIDTVYREEFIGMTRNDIPLSVLENTRLELRKQLGQFLTEIDVRFLLSFKQGNPDWSLSPIPGIERLPAVRWKLYNIKAMPSEKRREGWFRLQQALEETLIHSRA
ncbi:nucleotidyl transferase AbiEii/AbiGii toxin family protein [Methylonatrum kenyense]|uniref:nucleotidyl transferase AbiEii/AbiGii toxin family protein n=1 Tax=Methylonatrum kenyense TaxID=455253 RepID=UPI0020BD6099|nr:nucleotidyl transferase AbiEii/AbiGii toxin family protein [Methylonatrum kenyense]